MNKIQKIKAEIDRLQETTMNKDSNFKSQYDQGIFDGLSLLENFIDSLEEEPVSEDLVEQIEDILTHPRRYVNADKSVEEGMIEEILKLVEQLREK